MNQIGLNKNDILENITIEKLVFGGKGFARLKHSNPDLDGRVIFVTGGAIPGTVANLRIIKKKKAFLETQIVDIVKKSDIEIAHPTNKYGMSGGWKWINIPYNEQLKIKQEQVVESFKSIEKKIVEVENEQYIFKNLFLPIQGSPIIDGYRNKIEFSYGKYISYKNSIEQHFNLGFHKQGEFSKVEDMQGSPLIDEVQNEIFREIKKYTKTLGLPVYDQMRQEGFFRHLLIRKTYFTDEMMILLSFNPEYFVKNIKLDKSEKLNLIKDFLIGLVQKYPIIKSIYFSHNPNKADVCIGDLELIYGLPTIKEKILDLTFNISPTSFFQTNSVGAEKLYSIVLDFAKGKKMNNPSQPSFNYKGRSKTFGEMTVLDLYGGTGTIGMIFAKSGAKEVVSVELVTSASQDGEQNAKLNDLKNISFVNAKVENFLELYLNEGKKADLLVIDPPRAGMHPDALPNVLKFGTNQIIYVSCDPSTLVRDLGYILHNSDYKIEKIQAMDMFPHTHHIENVVSLIKN
ncbi:MAG: class I SAM-dependent RNA methyltransferase [Candidatus Gracilibacteria bacterium]|nr:class I SAM-dependent RNA methyltransferase [Candidatus Gracilibacteria bacterium]